MSYGRGTPVQREGEGEGGRGWSEKGPVEKRDQHRCRPRYLVCLISVQVQFRGTSVEETSLNP